ncbi:HAUS augmin-like complex subunit 1 isoform X2 [Corvus moneduloides]|uniref:HAUS augmin-like complex subunit 1 isoform X2 n=1 Tax=Corvus moneduloides TaxID=1196302 RepID=UPI001363BF33|nr:HAUS augmin-like complex subunit 1 isoform X2 [Corvus moneduloides]
MAAAAAAAGGARDPFEEKLIRVTLWLKKLYGDKPVPRYEVNERTVDILHEVMECNEERDRDVSLLIEDMKDQAAKYEAEAKYWQDILEESLGLSVDSLSQEATTDLNDLVESAMALEVEDTSLTSFYGAINYMTSELFKTKSKNEEMELKLNTLTKKLASTLTMEKQLEEDIKKITESQEAENAKAASRSKNLIFLEKKSEDLKIRVKDAEKQLIATGLDQSLTHEALVKLSEELAAVQEKLKPLKKEVESYHDLPPSIALARVMVEEARNELVRAFLSFQEKPWTKSSQGRSRLCLSS